MRFRPSDQLGFSLIEIMIAMVILSVIIYATVTIVNQNQKIKAGVDEEYALYHEVRAAVTLLEEDIAQVFILPSRYNLQSHQEIHDAIFAGEKQRLSCVTMNYEKRVAGQRDTHIREVEYFLLKDQDTQEGETAFTLFKKLTSFLDMELFGEGVEYPVLTDIKSWEFKFYDEKSKNWLDAWDSKTGDTKDRIPKAVSVSFEVYQRNPDNPYAEPQIIDFRTKFLADAWIERQRIFETSKTVQDVKKRIDQAQKQQPTQPKTPKATPTPQDR